MVFWSRYYSYALTCNKRANIAIPFLKGKVLDIGCGNAVLKEKLNSHCTSYTGIDISNDASDMKIDIENPIEREKVTGTFDSIGMLAVIEHLHKPNEVTKWCNQKLKKEGVIVITTPTLLGNVILRLFSIDAGHIDILNRERLGNILLNAGFKVIYYSMFELTANQIIVGKKE